MVNPKIRTVSVSLAVVDPGGGCVQLSLTTQDEMEAWLQIREGLRILAAKSDALLLYDGL